MRTLTPDVAATVSVDTAALDNLKRQAQRSPKEALAAATSQFEALFVQNVLKAMRDALPQDGLFGSDTMRAYTTLFDGQLAQEIGKRGIGLGKMLEKQLGAALDRQTPASDAASAGKVPAATATPAPRAQKAVDQAPASASSVTPPGSSGTSLPQAVSSFIDTMRPHAEAAARALGVPASYLLAQAGLETGWGRHQPKTGDGTATHNLFGIKAGRGWTGAVALDSTTEYIAGAVTRTVAKFRSYASYTDAFADFARMLTGNARYADALANAQDPAAFARSLQKSGYATDPHYADKLTRAIRMVVTHGSPGALDKGQVLAGSADNGTHEA